MTNPWEDRRREPRESADGRFLFYLDRAPGGVAVDGNARLMRVPYVAVIGEKEVEGGTVSPISSPPTSPVSGIEVAIPEEPRRTQVAHRSDCGVDRDRDPESWPACELEQCA